MSDRTIAQSDWSRFLQILSERAQGRSAEVRVSSHRIGEEIEAEWAKVLGLAYDPRDDVMEIALEGVDHLIAHPLEMWVHAEDDGVGSLLIVDGDERRQLVRFDAPARLPAS